MINFVFSVATLAINLALANHSYDADDQRIFRVAICPE